MHRILVVSDGTGGTAEQAVRAALTQFEDSPVAIERRPSIRSGTQALAVAQEAAEIGAFVVHTIVSTEVRNALHDYGRLHNVEMIDLMGPLLANLTRRLSDAPSETPGLFRELNREYFQRIDAMEFAFRHDDGQRTEELDSADIVLLGVSRTFKTPLSIYLAFRGWMVANVPIVLDLPLPEIVFELAPERVFGLTTDAARLAELRRARHAHLGGATGEYANLVHVRKELAQAHFFFSKRPAWSILDVTNKPIEEIATEILRIMRASHIGD